MADESRGALAGLRVLDISTFLAGPQISAILGDFGADVVKVEPPTGEASRMIGAQRNGASLMWALTSRNKRTITLDITAERGRDIFRELVAPRRRGRRELSRGQLATWGLSYRDLSAINPGLVMVSVSCYGNTGPLADRPGAGTLAEAFGGLTFMTGDADGPPMLPSIPLGDSLSALSGVIGALVACYHNKVNGGGGQHVDVSFYEPVLTLMQPTIIAYDPAGDEPPPDAHGLAHPDRRAPQRLSHCGRPLAGAVGYDRPPGRTHPRDHRRRHARGPGQVRAEQRSHRERRRARRARRRMDRSAHAR